jgi:hypothetical protein
MKLTIESTGTIEDVDGIPCRVWEGTSDHGVPVKAWIRTVSPQTHDPEALAAFERELLPQTVVRVDATTREIGPPPADWEDQHERLVGHLRLTLGGLHPVVQGSALAYLMALWAAGHQVSDEVRRTLLEHQFNAICEMLPIAGTEIEAIKRARLQ